MERKFDVVDSLWTNYLEAKCRRRSCAGEYRKYHRQALNLYLSRGVLLSAMDRVRWKRQGN